jgi:hypothetical protein
VNSEIQGVSQTGRMSAAEWTVLKQDEARQVDKRRVVKRRVWVMTAAITVLAVVGLSAVLQISDQTSDKSKPRHMTLQSFEPDTTAPAR